MMRRIIFLLTLGLAAPAAAQQVRVGPLDVRNSLGEIAAAGSAAQVSARTNLGLGSIATQAAGAVALTGGTINGAAIGATTPATGAFTALSASTSVTGGRGVFTSALAAGANTLSANSNLVGATGSSIAQNFSSVLGGATGTLTGGTYLYNLFQMQADNLNLGTTGTPEVALLGIYETFGGTSVTGARTPLRIALTMNGNTANPISSFHRGLAVGASTSYVDGGTSGTQSGKWFGQIIDANLLAGALYWDALQGLEIDTTLATGASANYKSALQLVKKSNDAVRGSIMDIALSITDQLGSSVGWKSGISFGAPNGVWPLGADSTLIGTNPTLLGGSAYVAANGVDISGVTFSGAAFKSTGFLVDPAGGTQTTTLRVTAPTVPATASDACAKGQISYAAGYVYICVATNTWQRAALASW
jgi:hypothetical protein